MPENQDDDLVPRMVEKMSKAFPPKYGNPAPPPINEAEQSQAAREAAASTTQRRYGGAKKIGDWDR
jgi:hypothetical protein